eukprot:scaffold85960_cov27-Phaeocystis_antarctica.AAC.1
MHHQRLLVVLSRHGRPARPAHGKHNPAPSPSGHPLLSGPAANRYSPDIHGRRRPRRIAKYIGSEGTRVGQNPECGPMLPCDGPLFRPGP